MKRIASMFPAIWQKVSIVLLCGFLILQAAETCKYHQDAFGTVVETGSYIFAFFFALGIFYWFEKIRSDGAELKDKIDSYLKISAAFGATCYFVFQAVTGLLSTGLDLSIQCSKEHLRSEQKDLLIVHADLSKGGSNSVRLRHVQASFVPIENADNGTPTEMIVKGMRRDEPSSCGNFECEKNNGQTLNPGDHVQLSAHQKAEPGRTYLVKFTVSGRTNYQWSENHWKSTCIIPAGNLKQ